MKLIQSQNPPLGLPHRLRDLSHPLLLCQAISMELHHKWSNQDLNRHSMWDDSTCRRRSNLLSRHTGPLSFLLVITKWILEVTL